MNKFPIVGVFLFFYCGESLTDQSMRGPTIGRNFRPDRSKVRVTRVVPARCREFLSFKLRAGVVSSHKTTPAARLLHFPFPASHSDLQCRAPLTVHPNCTRYYTCLLRFLYGHSLLLLQLQPFPPLVNDICRTSVVHQVIFTPSLSSVILDAPSAIFRLSILLRYAS